MLTTPTTEQDRIFIQQGFAWDAQAAYLFDIDGTLMRSRDRIHFNSFATSFKRVTGFELSFAGIQLAGNSDTAKPVSRPASRLRSWKNVPRPCSMPCV
jgi:hypothetical protein